MARIARKVLSRDSGQWLLCCWDDCEKPGVEMHKIVFERISYVFCSERHRQYFAYSHMSLGNLPPGAKKMIH